MSASLASVVPESEVRGQIFRGWNALNKSKHPSSSLYALGFLMQRRVMYSRSHFGQLQHLLHREIAMLEERTQPARPFRHKNGRDEGLVGISTNPDLYQYAQTTGRASKGSLALLCSLLLSKRKCHGYLDSKCRIGDHRPLQARTTEPQTQSSLCTKNISTTQLKT